MKVFVLFNGCYSGTRIAGIFSTQAYADLAAAIFTDDPHIEEFDLDAYADLMARGYTPWFVRLGRETSQVIEAYEDNSSYGAFSEGISADIDNDLYTTCWASTKAEAVKIASERRRTFLACRRWRTSGDI